MIPSLINNIFCTSLIRNPVDDPGDAPTSAEIPAKTHTGRILVQLDAGSIIRKMDGKVEILVVQCVERNVDGWQSVEVADRDSLILHEICSGRRCYVHLPMAA